MAVAKEHAGTGGKENCRNSYELGRPRAVLEIGSKHTTLLHGETFIIAQSAELSQIQ